MLSQILVSYVSEKFGLEVLPLSRAQPAPRSHDIVLHCGVVPWKKKAARRHHLIIFQSSWNDAERKIWKSRGATDFLSLSGSRSAFDRKLKSLLKT